MKNISIKSILLLILGVVVLVAGISICGRTALGIDPFNAMCIGFTNYLPISVGNMMLIGNLIIAIIVWFKKRDLIGPATIFVTLFFGYIFDFMQMFIPAGWFTADHIVLKMLIFLLGVQVMTIGVAIYMESDLGFAPYDCIAYLFTDKSKKPASFFRMILDMLVATTGFLLGGPISIGTVILSFFVGPFIDFHRKWVHGILGQTQAVLD